MKSFYHKLRYSLGNEDWASELKALRIKPTDRILSITASGDRPLNLLTTPLSEIVSVDANPVQNALCELKKSAIANLRYEEYLGFLGLNPYPAGRLKLFDEIKGDLSPLSLLFFTKERKKVEEGVLFQGVTEKVMLHAYKFLQLFSKKNINKLFSFDTLQEQRKFVEEEWNFRRWRKVFNIFIDNPLFTYFLGDPGLNKESEFPLKLGDYIYTRLEKSLMSFPVKENILVSLLFQGQLFPEAFAPYLTREGCELIRNQLPRLSLVTDNVINYLERCEENSFDGYSLSDIASYMPQSDFERLLKAVMRTARPNARFSIRELHSLRHLPKPLASHFQRESDLERELEEKDRCFLYRFKAGSIVK